VLVNSERVCCVMKTDDGGGDADNPRQLLDPTTHDDTWCFWLNETVVPTMTYSLDVPEALSRWTISVSLSPADWTLSDDCHLADTARRLIAQLQSATDQLTLPVAGKPVSLVSRLTKETGKQQDDNERITSPSVTCSSRNMQNRFVTGRGGSRR